MRATLRLAALLLAAQIGAKPPKPQLRPVSSNSKRTAPAATARMARAASMGLISSTPAIREHVLPKGSGKSSATASADAGMPAFQLPEQDLRKQLLAFVVSLTAPAMNSPVNGDVQAGEKFFFGKGGCSGCHMAQGLGGTLGPDLTA